MGMPKLTSEGLPNSDVYKFVREGDTIYFDESEKNHKVIARANGAQNIIDAGYIVNTGDQITVIEGSIGLEIYENSDERPETERLVEAITGKTIYKKRIT